MTHVSYESMTARQIADLHATDVFPDVGSALALIRVLAARLADLEDRFSGPITLGEESVSRIATQIAARLASPAPEPKEEKKP